MSRRRGPQSYPPELRARALASVRDHLHGDCSEWQAICRVAEQLGPSPTTIRRWVRDAATVQPDDVETRVEQSPDVIDLDEETRQLVIDLDEGIRQRVIDLEAENRELRRVNEILKAATDFFAEELNVRLPPQ